MSMDIPEVPTSGTYPQTEVHYHNHYKVPKNKTAINGEKFINGVILTIASVLFLGILATYFVRDLPSFVLNIREVSLQAVWVIAGSYAIGELLKIVFINRARSSTEYTTAKTDAETELKKISGQKNGRVKEYCEHISKEIFDNNRKCILAGSKLTLAVFETKYQALSTKEILQRFPEDNLSKAQLRAIKRANAVKKEIYDTSFLISIADDNNATQVPSKRYNSEKRNRKNSITSLLFSIVAGVFGVTLVKSLIFDFSLAILLEVIIKIIIMLFSIGLKLIFVNSLVFKTEIGRFNLQKTEAQAYMNWYEENPVKEQSNEERKDEAHEIAPVSMVEDKEPVVSQNDMEAVERQD